MGGSVVVVEDESVWGGVAGHSRSHVLSDPICYLVDTITVSEFF